MYTCGGSCPRLPPFFLGGRGAGEDFDPFGWIVLSKQTLDLRSKKCAAVVHLNHRSAARFKIDASKELHTDSFASPQQVLTRSSTHSCGCILLTMAQASPGRRALV